MERLTEEELLLFIKYKYLVIKIVQLFDKYNLDKDDLTSEGYIGLIIGIKRTEKNKASRYPYIYNYILSYVTNEASKQMFNFKISTNSLGNIGKASFDTEYKIVKTIQEMQESKEPLTPELVATIINEDINVVKTIMTKIRRQEFIAFSLANRENPKSAEDEYFKKINSEELNDIMSKVLSEKEREIIHYRYVNEKELVEIGLIFNLSRERIRQIEKRALEKIKEHYKKDNIVPPLQHRKSNKKTKTLSVSIYEMLSAQSSEEKEYIKNEVPLLEDDYQNYLYSFFGKNLEKKVDPSVFELKEDSFHKIIFKILIAKLDDYTKGKKLASELEDYFAKRKAKNL